MAQYLVLIYEDEAGFAGEGVGEEVHAAHTAFFEKHGAAIAGGNALEPAATATTIRGSIVTDGPFAETKEVLGGYYLIEAPDLDAALEIAKAVPARFGGVEVRPIRDMS
ncbi:MAG TPA: YciI family protein [Mycobacteriales bacterium]|nr:YciI family protein [Mycobacteriales bacterium]